MDARRSCPSWTGSGRSRAPRARRSQSRRRPVLRHAGITLAFAELKDPVRTKLRRYGALERVPAERIFPTVGTAVTGYIRASGETWTDWEEGGNG